MLTLVVMTDGRRDCLTRSIESMTNLSGPISVRMIHDDSGDVDYTEWLWDTFGDRWTIHSTDHRSGFAGAYRSMWKWIRDHDRNPYVLSTEDDFVFTRPVNLADMAGVLRRNPYLVQMALRRQAWNAEERAAGGVVEAHPDWYAAIADPEAQWLEHRAFWTTNPHLVRHSFIASHDWPKGRNSEGRFALNLYRSEPNARAGYWGSRESGEWVEHIGEQRVGNGY